MSVVVVVAMFNFWGFLKLERRGLVGGGEFDRDR